MHSLAHYALLGSLIAGAAGAFVLAVITLKHGILRRSDPDHEASADESAQRLRTVRLADTVAVLCFAVAAGLGVLGLTQGVRATSAVSATVDDAATRERFIALEARLATAEQQSVQGQHTRDMRGWEERLTRVESRLGAVEDQAAVAERRATDAERRATDAERRAGEAEQLVRREASARTAPAATPKKPPVTASPVNVPTALPPSTPVAPGSSPRLNPPGRDVPRAPEASRPSSPAPLRQEAGVPPPPADAPTPASRETPAVATMPLLPQDAVRASGEAREPAREPLRARADVTPREAARARPELAPPDVSFGERLRRDWATIRDHAERGGDEWRDGWRQLKRLFGD